MGHNPIVCLALALSLSTLAAFVKTAPAIGQTRDNPDFKSPRYEENYADMARLQRPLLPWERFKYVPLTADGSVWLSLGGELRERVEYQRNPDFGETVGRSNVWLQRAVLAADLHFGPVRFYGQLLHAMENGRPSGPSPVDRNDLDVQNAFMDLSLGRMADTDALVRLGRQELRLGSGRLVDPREGPNVRRTFDGSRGIFKRGSWAVTVVAVRPREDRFGTFDDRTNHTQGLVGAYGVGRDIFAKGTALDVYVLGYENEAARIVQGAGGETRTSIGTRWSGTAADWDWNWEIVGQTGRFAGSDIQAWTVATDTGFTFSRLPFSPRIGLSANVASGDRDASDDKLETFNPLFPRGNYFSEAAILGPRNFVNVHPVLTLKLSEQLTLTTDVNFFWRLEASDGIYSPSGTLVRAPSPHAGHYVATGVSTNLNWTITPFVEANAIYTRFEPGAFLKNTGPSEAVDFFELTLRTRF